MLFTPLVETQQADRSPRLPMQETKIQSPLRALLKDNSGKFRREKGAFYGSYYVSMRDDVRLAVDVYVPQDKFANNDLRFPTVFYMTRYGRSLQLRWPLEPIMPTQTTTVWRDEIEYLTRHGYCVVVVDARGTGASGGSREMEFSDEEA
ncbi:MAG: CocE/NonD family hydrolase, partial [Bacteroidota bacterium]